MSQCLSVYMFQYLHVIMFQCLRAPPLQVAGNQAVVVERPVLTVPRPRSQLLPLSVAISAPQPAAVTDAGPGDCGPLLGRSRMTEQVGRNCLGRPTELLDAGHRPPPGCEAHAADGGGYTYISPTLSLQSKITASQLVALVRAHLGVGFPFAVR